MTITINIIAAKLTIVIFFKKYALATQQSIPAKTTTVAYFAPSRKYSIARFLNRILYVIFQHKVYELVIKVNYEKCLLY